MTEPILEVRDLHVEIPTSRGVVHAVDGASFSLEQGDVLGLVGESGCGKTMTLRAICGLLVRPAHIVSGQVLYNGVDLTRFHPENRSRFRADARAEAALPAGAFTALFVGSGFARKGLATAIEAIAALSDRESRLVVIGKGERRLYQPIATRSGVAERLVWLGARSDLERWYAAADVVVLPSRYEPFGNVHLEALASGLPVIASARAGGAEVIADGINGTVVDPLDSRAVTAALERFHQRRPGELTAAARASAEPYTYAAQVQGFAKVYGRCARARCDFS